MSTAEGFAPHERPMYTHTSPRPRTRHVPTYPRTHARTHKHTHTHTHTITQEQQLVSADDILEVKVSAEGRATDNDVEYLKSR